MRDDDGQWLKDYFFRFYNGQPFIHTPRTLLGDGTKLGWTAQIADDSAFFDVIDQYFNASPILSVPVE
jgi:hypothetical protein